MPRSPDFEKVCARFTKQYGDDKGSKLYNAWLSKKGYDDTKPLNSQKKEKKELSCVVKGVEIKETDLEYHIEGLITTTHIDQYDSEDISAGIPDMVLEETIDAWVDLINSDKGNVCGIHHSEGRTGDYGAKGTLARKVDLPEGHKGLWLDTVVLKDDPVGMQMVKGFENGDLTAFSITYDTDGMSSVDFDIIDNRLVRVLNPETKLFGYTAASNPVNPQAIAIGYGYKEFKEFMVKEEKSSENKQKEQVQMEAKELQAQLEAKEAELQKRMSALEAKELEAKEKEQKAQFEKELKEKVEAAKLDAVKTYVDSTEFKAKLDKMVEEKAKINGGQEIAPELKEYFKAFESKESLDFSAVGKLAESYGLIKGAEYKATSVKNGGEKFDSFGVNGRFLEVKGLSIGSNANAYTQAQAELDNVYDPMIWNLLNQGTVTWNYLTKEDYSGKGNNNVQFRVKTGTNPTVGFYTGNEVTTGKGTRAKYQTKFKKIKVGVEIDGDMIAAAGGSSVGNVWNLEVQSATEDLLSAMNVALFGETGLETGAEPIGFEYITDSAGNTSLYGVTRTAANGLAHATPGDVYVNGASGYSLTLARKVIRNVVKDGSQKGNLFFVCDPVVADVIKLSQDPIVRLNGPTMTRFGFETALFIDGVPVLEDKDCQDDDLFLIDKAAHKIAMWLPPTLEMLGKRADNEEGFIKCYYAVFNTAPRRMAQIYGITGVPA